MSVDLDWIALLSRKGVLREKRNVSLSPLQVLADIAALSHLGLILDLNSSVERGHVIHSESNQFTNRVDVCQFSVVLQMFVDVFSYTS